VLRVSATAPISVVGLRGRYNERADFLITTVPVTDDSVSPSSEPIYFPHFVTGGGYSTQFMMLGPLRKPAVSFFIRHTFGFTDSMMLAEQRS
jgi:hypothetical protein